MEKEALQDNNIAPSQTQPIIPEISPASKSPKRKTGLIIGITALFLLLLGITGLFAYQNYQLKKQTSQIQPTPTPKTVISPTLAVDTTAGWKTFTSSALGFTFNYPIEYESPEERENYLSLISPLNPNRGKGYELQNDELKIEIVTEAAKEDNSPMRCWNDHNAGEGKILNQSEIDIGGTNTTIIDWAGHGTGQFICIARDEQRYLINKYPLKTTRQIEFNQILSTFKFLDQDNSNKIVCKNQALKMSLVLPSQSWTCDSKEESEIDGWVSINSNLFEINMSNLGRGAYCWNTPEDPEGTCKVTPFYSNDILSLSLFNDNGEDKEIFGSTKVGPWISIKYNNMEKRKLAESEKTELFQLLDSISFTE